MVKERLYKYEISTVKPVLSEHSKRRPKIGFQYQLLLNAGQKYSRMLHGEHSVILLTFIKLPLSIKTFVLSIFSAIFSDPLRQVLLYQILMNWLHFLL